MARKRDKDGDRSQPGRADAVRSAVNEAFSATAEQSAAAAGQGREAAQDIVDQLAQAAGRVREVIDELRPPTGDDVRGLRRSIEALERRVAALEQAQKAPARKPAAKRGSTGRSTSGRSKS